MKTGDDTFDDIYVSKDTGKEVERHGARALVKQYYGNKKHQMGASGGIGDERI